MKENKKLREMVEKGLKAYEKAKGKGNEKEAQMVWATFDTQYRELCSRNNSEPYVLYQ